MTMTVKELAARIGEDALVSFEKGNVTVRCRIVDARTAYGKAQLLVEPVAGSGSTWVEEARIQLRTKPCGNCNGKGFLNPDGTPINAFTGSDNDPTILCPVCNGSEPRI
jgi:hypothetical protein